jgi:hypothetical protein
MRNGLTMGRSSRAGHERSISLLSHSWGDRARLAQRRRTDGRASNGLVYGHRLTARGSGWEG